MNKTAIKNFAISARILLINAVTQIAFEYEVTEDGKNDPSQESVNGRTLTATEKSQRAQLISNIRLNGFTQTMEEAAYTWFNRFIALRFMEVNNYLPSHTRLFSNENGAFKPEVLSDAVNLGIEGLDRDLILEMLENQENERLYKYILIAQCNALNDGLPEMFEQIGGWTELLFPRNLLREDSVIAKMVTEIPEEDWRDQVQIIGWLYQYYNTEPKDKVFADLKKNIKISAAAIPAATQLFTPDWIVRYMVENSLGRLWAEGHGKPADADWKYYLEEAEQEDSVKAELAKIREEYRNIQPEQIKVIDPCMGSGHILVYAFDVLMQIYVSCGWSERDAAKSILRHNLYGLDIDRRAYQLAYFAVMMKARQYNRRILDAENQPNLANFADVMGVDTTMLEGKIMEFAEQFAYADTYGSLMEVTAPDGLDEEVSEFNVSFGMSRRQLDMMMKIYTMLSQKYDVVCTNPPYMGGSGMNAKLTDFVKNSFPDSKSDLFSCFIEKAYLLAKPSGFTSLITMESWMFLSSFEKLRQKINHTKTIINMVHMPYLGKGGTSLGINFGTAAVVTKNSRIANYAAQYEYTVYYETDDEGVPFVFPTINERWKTAKQENFSKIPGMPVAYWVSEAFVRTFTTCKEIEYYGSTSKGIITGDNSKFLRLWHEISNSEINFSAENYLQSEQSDLKWYPCNKGGDFRRWYGNNEYVIDWKWNGYVIMQRGQTKVRNCQDYKNEYKFIPSITWTSLSSSYPSFRYSKNALSESAGMTLFIDINRLFYCFGYLNSVVAAYTLKALNPTLNFTAGVIASLPLIVQDKYNPNIEKLVKSNIEISKTDWDAFETSWDFEQHPLI